MIGVPGLHNDITIAVENDGRDSQPVFRNARSLTEFERR